MLTKQQMTDYRENGFLLIDDFYSAKTVAAIIDEIPSLLKEHPENCVFEANSNQVRAIHGTYKNARLKEIYSSTKLIDFAEKILANRVYLYQLKINFKAAFQGEIWPWHQDYEFWSKDDFLPEASLINMAVFLDQVTEFNGPMYFIPGSHKYGLINETSFAQKATSNTSWHENFNAKLKYTVATHDVERLVAKHGITSTKGKAGSLLLFDSRIVHASAPNISPFQRRILLATYNSITNLPSKLLTRPEFLVNRV